MLRALPPSEPTWEMRAEVMVIGGGAAGLSAALSAASRGTRVLLVSKGAFGSGSTPWAQGGLAAAIAADDSAELHAADTRSAGTGLGNPNAIRELTSSAPSEILALQDIGAVFDHSADDALDLAREGGHSRNRVVHAGGDASGAEVSRALWAATHRNHRIDILEPCVALDIVLSRQGRVVGVVVGRIKSAGRDLDVGLVHTVAVILATGGVGQVFSSTTNPPGATGDGLALAARAGAQLTDLEFVQFHPTVLWTDGSGSGQRALITEALRGAGAHLLDNDGIRFMVGRHELAELAPRDVIAAAMQQVMTESQTSHLWLDATMLGSDVLERQFPTMLDICVNAGIDPLQELIPVTPGAHYSCGGIRTDLDGRTSVRGLLAAGEVACTGLHGANRLASNSLTEALHFGRRAGAVAPTREWPQSIPYANVVHREIDLSPSTVEASARAAIATTMTRNGSVMRSAAGLEAVLEVLDNAPTAQPGNALNLDQVETWALHSCATLIANSALLREESRGCHRRSDFPTSRLDWRTRHVTMMAHVAADHIREQIPA